MSFFIILKDFIQLHIDDFLFALLTGIIASFLGFILVLVFFTKAKIAISGKISRSLNYSYNPNGQIAWKFKIVNKSMITSFTNFDIKLIGIKYKIAANNTKTQHRTKLDSIVGVRELQRYIPTWIVNKKRKKDSSYTIEFAYRPLTFLNLDELSREYDEFELSVICTDTLIGKPHIYKKSFKTSLIEEGDFTNDGRLNEIIPKAIPESIKKEMMKKERKEKLSKKITNFWRNIL